MLKYNTEMQDSIYPGFLLFLDKTLQLQAYANHYNMEWSEDIMKMQQVLHVCIKVII